MEQKTFIVPNIGCDGCVRTIKNELSEVDGVSSVDAAVDTKQVTIVYNDAATWEKVLSTLKEIDYAPAES